MPSFVTAARVYNLEGRLLSTYAFQQPVILSLTRYDTSTGGQLFQRQSLSQVLSILSAEHWPVFDEPEFEALERRILDEAGEIFGR